MATLVLTQLWINLMSSGQAISAYSRDRPREHSMEGKVSTFASGRQRSIATVGERGEMSFTLAQVTEAQITTLRSWMGQSVSVRDYRGQRYIGTYYSLKVAEQKSDPTLYDVTMTLSFIAFQEGV